MQPQALSQSHPINVTFTHKSCEKLWLGLFSLNSIV